MAVTIQALRALEILDSRGRPTLMTEVELSDGARASAQVPSGASTGRHEACELRDGDAGRYGGQGVLQAAAHVEGEIQEAVRGLEACDQQQLDRRLIELDGTERKQRLGANAILSVSCAVARAAARSCGVELWRHLAEVFGTKPVLPLPMINIISGGLHGGRNIDFQDFLYVPLSAGSFAEAMERAVGMHGRVRAACEKRGYRLTGVADEGGWAPLLRSSAEALEILAGELGGGDGIAVDVAATHFFQGGGYRLEGRVLTSGQMTELLTEWVERYPLVSIEDPLAEDDWEGWRELTRALGERVQVVGDDLLTTNTARLRRGIAEGAANAVLVKMNQIGTLTETFEALAVAREAGWRAVISARSGETEDAFLADLAVASGAGQIKVGSVTRSERLAKYNRLLEIERRRGLKMWRWAG